MASAVARARHERRRDTLSIGVAGGPVPPTAPVLSAASAVDFSDIIVWGQATTDTASGTLYAVVVPAAAATPTAGQIVAGTDAADAAAPNANVAVTSTGVKNVLVRGLTAVTAYKVCMTQMVSAVRLISSTSNVVTGSFTTDTLVIAFATNGLTTGMTTSTGSAALGTAQADPHGGTNALRWTDSNDSVTGQVLINGNGITFFNGVNKLHMTAKVQGGAPFIRLLPTAVTVSTASAYWNASTGAIGTLVIWSPTPVSFNVGSGWWMFSGRVDLTGADVTGALAIYKTLVDNNPNTVVRNGTNIQDIYNIRITRV